MMIQHILHDKDELSPDCSVTQANEDSQLEFSMSISEDKYLPNIS